MSFILFLILILIAADTAITVPNCSSKYVPVPPIVGEDAYNDHGSLVILQQASAHASI